MTQQADGVHYPARMHPISDSPCEPTCALAAPKPSTLLPISHTNCAVLLLAPPTQVGTGRFQWLVLLVCGLANAADAVEILSVGLLGAAAMDDLQVRM